MGEDRPLFRIERSKAFEFSEEHDAYLFYGTKLSLGQKEWKEIQCSIACYEADYDKRKEGELAFARQDFLDFLGSQLVAILKDHEVVKTLAPGENSFLLSTGKNEYKITIERLK